MVTPDLNPSLPQDTCKNSGHGTRLDAEQAVIRDIQAMRAGGMTLEAIPDALTTRGVPTKTGKSERCTHQAVARILQRTNVVLGDHK